ncbi:MAG: glycosyltransferase [Mangrovibacterium sp.]
MYPEQNKIKLLFVLIMNNLQPTIVVIAYNRPYALRRILNSLASANYKDYKNIRLIVSIDGGGENNVAVREIANTFQWDYGELLIISHSENLGLRKHVIFCADLTEKYQCLILLEEDCFVSRFFFDYACKSMIYYENDQRIAGISLYNYPYYEPFGTCFRPLNDGFDTYFMQAPSSLGQIWTKTQWKNFRLYYNANPKIEANDRIPEKVKIWPETSWKKYFYKYMTEENLFFVYPQIAYTTNFGDEGAHSKVATQYYQVELERFDDPKIYNFAPYDSSNNKYDAYFELLPECFIAKGAEIKIDTCIDISGSKPLKLFDNRYALSCKACNNPIRSYDSVLIPLSQNVFYETKGKTVHYALLSSFGELKNSSKTEQIANSQPLGFSIGKKTVISGTYYKIGYYLLNPLKILGMLKRRTVKRKPASLL